MGAERRMPLIPLAFPPGMKRAGTLYQSRGRYYDGSLVRFFEDTARPVGGWVALGVKIQGKPRAIHAWRTSEGLAYFAIGTNVGVYAYQGGTTYDITDTGTEQGEVSTSGTGRPYQRSDRKSVV